jgi:hypothetical protein
LLILSFLLFAPDGVLVICISPAPAALDRYLAALPAMSLIPFAPFADLRNVVRLTGFLPHDVFIVSSVDQSVHLAVSTGTKQNPAFDTLAEENLWCFREQLLFFAVPFNE